MSMVILRTIGNTRSNTGNAISHEIPHAETHVLNENCSKPILLNVLIHDTIKVIIMDSKKGRTIEA